MAQQWWEAAPVVKQAPRADARGAVEYAAPVDPMSPAEATRLGFEQQRIDMTQQNDLRAQEERERKRKDLSETQSKGLGFYQRMRSSDVDFERLGMDPQGYAELLANRTSPNFSRAALSDERRTQLDAMENFIAASLRLESGAAIGPSEFDKQARIFFPTPGAGPKEIEQKRKQRELAIRGFRAVAGEYGGEQADMALRELGYIDEQGKPVIGAIDPESGPLVTAPGTTRAAAMGAITPGEPVMTDEDMAAGRAIQEAWNATGKFEDVARVAAQFGRSFGEEEAAFLRANEGKPVNINANATGTPSPTQEAVGEFVSTPGGEMLAAGAVASGNATAFGLLDELAPVLGLDAERVQMAKRYLQDKQPLASIGGEIAGSIAPGAALARGVNVALGGGRLAGFAPGAGDALAGALAGAGEANENRLGGAALGAGVGTAAGVAGRRVFGGGPAVDGGADGGGMTPQNLSGGMGGASGGRASGGAAATPDDVIRVMRAQELPVPVQLANFQKSRAFEQQQRARELAKNNEVGGPIRELFAEQQRALAANFDAFLEQTGSEVWQQAEEQGIRITAGIKKMADQSKAKYRALYKKAETSGETREPVAYDELRAYIAEQTPTTRNKLAPVLQAVNEQLSKNDAAGTGQITLQQLEDVRKLINKTVEPGTPNDFYGRDMKGIIDGITENAGGDVYKAARAARREHAVLFDEVGTIAQLLGTKRGTADRVVAAEQVVDKLISSATPAASLRKLRDLVTGEGGDPQAWKEVQGAAIERIRNAAYPPGATLDESGARVVSVAGLRRIVDRMEQQGKLDVIFDYETAKGLRTIADVAQDVFTAPPGAVNTSGTSSALLNALDMVINFGVAGVPIPGGVVNNVLKPIAGRVRNRDMRKEVKQLIGEPTQ